MNEEAMRRAHEAFERDGLVLIPGLFTGDEIDKHNEIVRAFRVELSATQGSTTSVERIGQLHQLDKRLMLLACNPFIRDFLSVQLKDAPRLFGRSGFKTPANLNLRPARTCDYKADRKESFDEPPRIRAD
jgi:hypothetical protein